jgi:signal transduction histidine kinase
VALLTLFGFLAIRAIDESKDVALEDRLRLAETTAESVDALIQHTTRQLEAATLILLLGPDDAEKRQMEQQYQVLGTFDKIVRLDPSGQVLWIVPAAADAPGWAFAGDRRVLDAVQEGETAIAQVSGAGVDHPPMAVIITPVRDGSRAKRGFLAGELHLSHAGFPLVPLPEQEGGIHAEVVDARGYILAQTALEEPSSLDEHVDVLAPFIASGRPGTIIHRADSGSSHVVAYHPLESMPGGVVVEQLEDAALALPSDMERTVLVFGLGSLVVASGAAWLHARTVVRPIRDLTNASERIAAGSLDDPIVATREDEVGQLARRFDEMRVKLRASLEESARWAAELEDRVRDRTREVDERNRDLETLNRVRRQLLAKTISAQEEERKRLARELHDDSAQTLTALLMTLRTAEDALISSPGDTQRGLAKGRSQVEMALREIRKAIMDLRPTALDDLGLASAARWFADETLRPLGVKVSVKISGDEGRASGTSPTAIFRIVQEAVSNIAKHARAKNAIVSLELRESEVLVLVEDDGQGFDPDGLKLPKDGGRGLGLLGMRERAELFGGTVDIESSPGRGTRIRVRVPLE